MPEVDFFGEKVRLADEPNEFAMAEFAAVASRTDSDQLAGLAAVMELLESCVHPDDWQRFRTLARKNSAKVERDLMPVVVALFEQETERPTQQPSDSSAGLPSTAANSTGGSSQPAMHRPSDPFTPKIEELNSEGRPDLALFLVDARARSTA